MEERIIVKDCNCERGCQHKVVSVVQEFIVHKAELKEFLEDFKS